MQRITFGELRIGDTFRFTSEYDWPYSGMKKGLCEKISPRKYRYVHEPDFPECRIGSISATVVKTGE